jgi:hypothetical protein
LAHNTGNPAQHLENAVFPAFPEGRPLPCRVLEAAHAQIHADGACLPQQYYGNCTNNDRHNTDHYQAQFDFDFHFVSPLFSRVSGDVNRTAPQRGEDFSFFFGKNNAYNEYFPFFTNFVNILRLFQNFSFWKSYLCLKLAFWTVFLKPFPKKPEFWKWLSC